MSVALRERARLAAMLDIKYRNVPEEAQWLTQRVCQDQGVEVPYIEWTQLSRHGSSGICYHERQLGIHIKAGTEQWDQRLVLLHELAHWVMPPREGHSRLFWQKAYSFYWKYGIGVEAAYERERHYRKEAAIVGHQAMLAIQWGLIS